MATTTRTDNEDLIRGLTEAWNDRDREAMADLYADEIRVHGPETVLRPVEEHLDLEWGFFEAFPDVTAAIEELLSDDDRVFVRWTVTGTHEGDLDGVDPTGTVVEYEEWALYGVADGEIIEIRSQSDELGILEQLDAVDWPGN